MTKPKTTQLREFYERARAMQAAGCVLDERRLAEEFGVTVLGASCLAFMLEEREYCPELERIYRQKDDPLLRGKDLERVDFIQFLEDMPPFQKLFLVDEEVSKPDKDLYVSLGLARRRSPDEMRRRTIELFVFCSRRLDQHRADFLEAIAHHDAAFMQAEFKNKPEAVIKKQLKKLRFTGKEIAAALRIWRAAV